MFKAYLAGSWSKSSETINDFSPINGDIIARVHKLSSNEINDTIDRVSFDGR